MEYVRKFGGVLLVEDNDPARLILESLLDSMGIAVTAVSDGPQAITAMIRRSYALVLMDLQLPGLDGIETTRCLRSIRPIEPIPFVVITASGSTRSEILAAGFEDLIFKPFGRSELATAVSKWIRAQPATLNVASVLVAPPNALEWDLLLADLPPHARSSVAKSLVSAAAHAIDTLDQSLAQKNLMLLGKTAHDLKGIFGYLNFGPLAALAQRLFDNSRAGLEAEAMELARHIAGEAKAKLMPPLALQKV